MPDVSKLIIERFPNDDVIVFHATVELSRSGESEFHRPLHPERDRADIENLGPIGSLLVPRLLTIPGVHFVEVDTYELSVEKGVAFTWDELMPQVFELIAEYVFHAKRGDRLRIEQRRSGCAPLTSQQRLEEEAARAAMRSPLHDDEDDED